MQASDHLRAFLNQSRRARNLLARQEGFHSEGILPKTELEAIFELSFLNIFSSFETQISELMKTNMLLENGSDGNIRSLSIPRSRAQSGRILQGTGRYVQLMPIEQLEKIATVYLKGGKPFTTLSEGEKTQVRKCYAIRNHIAHKSDDSRRSFKKKILDQVSIPAHRHTAGFYLRSQISRGRTYFDHHAAELGKTLQTLCSAT